MNIPEQFNEDVSEELKLILDDELIKYFQKQNLQNKLTAWMLLTEINTNKLYYEQQDQQDHEKNKNS